MQTITSIFYWGRRLLAVFRRRVWWKCDSVNPTVVDANLRVPVHRKQLARKNHHIRGASLVFRLHSAFASLTNTTSIRSLAENPVKSNSYAIRSLSGDFFGLGHRLGLFTLFIVTLSIGRVAAADAESGRGVGFGPVLSLNFDGTGSIGWEVGGNYLWPFAKGSLGGDYRLVRKAGKPSFRHYVAYEPWLFVGATVGATVTNEFPVSAFG